jgi:hypothetical protein
MFEDSPPKAPRLSRPDRGHAHRVLERVREALHGLQYGEVTVIVQDGVIVQVERTDRMRLPRRRSDE